MDQGFRMETGGENYFENFDWEGKVEYNTTDIFLKHGKRLIQFKIPNITHFGDGKIQLASKPGKSEPMTSY